MRIHIVCPSDEVTGSAESLHQFGRAAATLGWDARIAYGGDPIFGAVPSAFRSYGLRGDQDVADEPDVLVLVAHSDVAAVAHLTRARKLVWWLRVDEAADDVNERALAVPNAVHLAQSEYARHFLSVRGVDAALVGDYISPTFIARAERLIPATKLDSVLYNPDSSDRLTPQLIEASTGVLQWVPVSGLSQDDVAELMAYSKVYVDFGSHRGRTRVPREALAAGCCVVSGRRGAAGNDLDLVLPEGFVFDEDAPDAVGHVLNRIALAVMEFRPTSFDFMPAREAVRAERERFASQVAAATTAVAADDTRLASTTR